MSQAKPPCSATTSLYRTHHHRDRVLRHRVIGLPWRATPQCPAKMVANRRVRFPRDAAGVFQRAVTASVTAHLGFPYGRGNAPVPSPGPVMPPISSMPPMPSMPSLGGTGSPGGGLTSGVGPLSGLFGGFGPGGLLGTGGNFANPAGLQGQAAQAISQAMTCQFGNGFAAGAGAAGVGPALAAAEQAVPKTPAGPLAAPVGETAPVSAAPLAAAAAPAPAEAPMAAGGGEMGAPMTPYGSVLPPSAATPAGGGLGSGPACAAAERSTGWWWRSRWAWVCAGAGA